jgi:ubiquinone/menaquinone biosynthesis C-methylase UbiE
MSEKTDRDLLSSNCCGPSLPDGPEARRELVRERYAALATEGSCCCGPDDVSAAAGYAAALYSEEELARLPEGVMHLAMGCGNPSALAGLKPGMTVVDLGSGGGVDAVLAAYKVGPAGRVIGVDMTEQMISRARAAVEDLGLANVEFRLGRIEELPLDDGIADVVISNCVINLSPEKDRVFREAFRVLRLGGLLAVSDMVLQAVRDNPAAWSSCVSGAIFLEEYLDLMRAAGFRQPVVKDLDPYSGEQVRAFKEIDEQRFPDGVGSLSAGDTESLDGCLASARIVSLKFESCC